MFHFQDVYLIPKQGIWSFLISTVAGYGLGIFVIILQFPFSKLVAIAEKRGFIFKLLATYLFLFITSLSTVLIWRGTWNLVKVHLITGDFLGGWVCHVIAVLGFLFLMCFSTVESFDIGVDAEEPGGSGIILPMDYFSVLIQRFEKQDTEVNMATEMEVNFIN